MNQQRALIWMAGQYTGYFRHQWTIQASLIPLRRTREGKAELDV
jgi:hypothetical protein